MSQSCLYQHFCQNRGEKRQYTDTKSSCYSLDKNVVKLPELNVVLNKLLPLLNKAKDLNYDKTYDSFLPLMWKTHHQICIPKSLTNKKYISHSCLESHNLALQLNTYTSHRNWLNHEIWSMCMLLPLCEKCPNSDRIRENTDQKNSLFRHFSSSVLMLVQSVSYTR